MSNNKKLLTPLVTASGQFRNRVVMAPMNRRRALQGVPGSSAITYYAQRASAGLIITDNTAVAANGFGYLNTPGIYNEAQKVGWKKVAEAVHARNGKIFMQLVHTGRIGHPLNHVNEMPLVAPSSVAAAGDIRVPGDVHLSMPQPQALTAQGVQEMIAAHIKAAKTAVEIGFDGVEIHGAHGFLPEQFMHPHTNRRTDQYGGSIVNRSRFLLEIMEGVVAAIGKDRTGIRLSPFAGINDLPAWEEEKATHRYITDALKQLDILYIHLSAVYANGQSSIPDEYIKALRKNFPNLVMLAGGYTADRAEAALQSGLADLIAFGKPFVSNPDLVERFRHHAPLADWDESTFYSGGDEGYIDYPALHCNTGSACLALG